MGSSYVKSAVVVAALCSLAAQAAPEVCFGDRRFDLAEPALWRATTEHSLAFFAAHARDAGTGAYFSEIADEGTPLNRQVHVLALSRLVYALASASTQQPEHRAQAEKTAAYLLTKLTAIDNFGEYFIATRELGGAPSPEPVLHVWEQAYGLCGLVELYRHNSDPALLHRIHALYDGLLARFTDHSSHGGLAMDWSAASGLNVDSKGYASVIYPATAFLINLWEADPSRRDDYARLLQQLTEIAEQHLWDARRGWVNESLCSDWRPRLRADGTPDFTAVPGHSFQLAWFFLRAAQWPFFTAARQAELQAKGLAILDATLAKPIWDTEHGGFYAQMNPVTNEPTARHKDWWQHAEALPALALAHRLTHDERYAEEFRKVGVFYVTAFFDHERGGEWFSLDAQSRPVRTQPKGGKGKSSYHVAEAAAFVEAYLR